MIDFVQLFNAILKIVRKNLIVLEAHSMSDTFEEIGIDSLDGLTMMIYFIELYGIDEQITKEWHPTSIQECYDLIMKHKTKSPSSIEDAIKNCK